MIPFATACYGTRVASGAHLPFLRSNGRMTRSEIDALTHWKFASPTQMLWTYGAIKGGRWGLGKPLLNPGK